MGQEYLIGRVIRNRTGSDTSVRYRIAAAVFLLLAFLAGEAVADRAYGVRYTINQNGDLEQIGNVIVTCDPIPPATGAANCAAGQGGGNYSNNDFSMINVDVDADGSTFNSSSATLSLPSGSTVTFAGL